MLYSERQIVTRIKGHIKRRGGAYKTWVVGIDKEPRSRLFTSHRVRKVGDFWILMHAKSCAAARKVQSYLIKKVGLRSGLKLEDPSADFVYAYMRSGHTTP